MLDTQTAARAKAIGAPTVKAAILATKQQNFLDQDAKISTFREQNVSIQSLNRDHFILIGDLKQTNFMGQGWSKAINDKYGEHYAHFMMKHGIEHAVIVRVHKETGAALKQCSHAELEYAHENLLISAQAGLGENASARYVYEISSDGGSQNTSLTFNTTMMASAVAAVGAIIIGAVFQMVRNAMTAAAAIEASAYVSFEETGVLTLVEITAAQAVTLGLSILAITGLLLWYFLQKQIALNFTIGNFSSKYIEITDSAFYNASIEKEKQDQPYLAPPGVVEERGLKFKRYDAIGTNIHNDSQLRGIGAAYVLYDKQNDKFCAFVMRCDHNGNTVINMALTEFSSAQKALDTTTDADGTNTSLQWGDLTVSLTISEKANGQCAGTFTIEDTAKLS